MKSILPFLLCLTASTLFAQNGSKPPLAGKNDKGPVSFSENPQNPYQLNGVGNNYTDTIPVKDLPALNLIPYPSQVYVQEGKLAMPKKIRLQISLPKADSSFIIPYLLQQLRQQYGVQLANATEPATNVVVGLIGPQPNTPGDYFYRLLVNAQGIQLQGNSPQLVFNGIQTLLQLVEKKANNTYQFPFVGIGDKPRFAYRGMHLDVGRHFFPVAFIKQYIDWLAYHKINTFHWHLTEDQGWRIEIKKYPELTRVGAWRNGTIVGRYPGTSNTNQYYGGFYTQEEIKEVVKYAGARYIEVIPEIEMPGHSSAAIAAYPQLSCFPKLPTPLPESPLSERSREEMKNGRIKIVQETWGVFDDVLCAGNDSTFVFLQDVIDEVIALFPSTYFHIGGDECPKTHWKKCPRCQQRRVEFQLRDEHELQSYFVQRIEKYLNSKGKIMIGWDEILEGGLAPNAVVMSWRGEHGGIEAAKQKHNVIMTPGSPLYFDNGQRENEDSVFIGGFNPIEKVYAYDPLSKELTADQQKFILGAQANVWTEYMSNPKKIEYMIFPRIAALSEILWTPKRYQDWNFFEKRLMPQLKRYEAMNIDYCPGLFDLRSTIIPAPDQNGVLWKLESKSTEPIYINYNNWDTIWPYKGPQPITFNTRASASSYVGGLNMVVRETFHFNKATGKNITLTVPPAKQYNGDGAFTLVNGIQNEKGMARSREFLGFSGTDCIATIDLGSLQSIQKTTIHTFEQKASWIHPPSGINLEISDNGTDFRAIEVAPESTTDERKRIDKLILRFSSTNARYLRVSIKNAGVIPARNAGAGNKAWLFVDEIEVE
ncbi:MAG: beta-N-acetylhexosaminidase [Bacteroidetes bacterium]|nr:beta-N-acetylhexosaminidase [Bacteroidota bacterium]